MERGAALDSPVLLAEEDKALLDMVARGFELRTKWGMILCGLRCVSHCSPSMLAKSGVDLAALPSLMNPRKWLPEEGILLSKLVFFQIDHVTFPCLVTFT